MALGAAEALGTGPFVLEDLALRETLTLPGEGERTLQVVLTSEPTNDRVELRILSLDPEAENPSSAWTLHATGILRHSPLRSDEGTAEADLLDAVRQRCPEECSSRTFYETLRQRGVDLGPTLQTVETLWHGRSEALGLVRNVSERGLSRIHPAFLDGCLQVLGAATLDHMKEAAFPTYLFVGLDRLSLPAEMPDRVWSHARVRNVASAEDKVLVGDVRILDETGRVLGGISGIRLVRATREAVLRSVAGQTAPGSMKWSGRPNRSPVRGFPLRRPSTCRRRSA